MEKVLNCVPSPNLKTFNDLGNVFKNPIGVFMEIRWLRFQKNNPFYELKTTTNVEAPNKRTWKWQKARSLKSFLSRADRQNA